MVIEHLPANATPDEVVEILRRDGCAVIDRLAEADLVDRVAAEMRPYMDAVQGGPDAFSGAKTRRTGGLVARSAAARELITRATILGAVKGILTESTSFQLHLTQMIAIGPGEDMQAIHRDQWAFDFFSFPSGFEVQCNTIWAMTDFTEANGATRVIPGSHRAPDKQTFGESDTVPAEMEKGSALLYTGSLYHGGGANRSDAERVGINITYARGWLRQEENQYLTVPHDLARTLPDDLLKLIGYARGAYALGYVDDLRDPLEVLRGPAAATGFGDLDRAARRAGGHG